MLEPDDATLSALRLQYCVTFSTLLTAYKQYQCMLTQSWSVVVPEDFAFRCCLVHITLELLRGSKLDFDDLLVLGVRLVEACPVIAEVISTNCHHLLVDEFQDTNTLQYRLVRGVTRRHGNVFVVGDPYQVHMLLLFSFSLSRRSVCVVLASSVHLHMAICIP
jgi:hypothetical protein